MAMHAVLIAKLTSWPAWAQLLHPLATVIAKSKLLVLPVYPAAWPQAKKHPFVQLVFESYETIRCLYVIKKVGFRYRQAEIAGVAAVERLERTAGLASVVGGCARRMSPNISVSKGPLRNCVRSSRDGQFSSQPNTTKRRNGKPQVGGQWGLEGESLQ